MSFFREMATGLATDAIGSLAARLSLTLYGKVVKPAESELDLGALLVETPDGQQLVLTDADIRDIAAFIRDPDVAAVAQGYVLLKSVENHYKDAKRNLEYLESAFLQLADD